MSSGLGGLRFGLKVVARNPCPTHGVVHTDTDVCQEGYVGQSYNEHDMGINQFAVLLITNIFATASATNAAIDVTGTTHTISANTATSAIVLAAGSGLTAPVFGDNAIQSQLASTSGSISATVNNTITNLTSSGTFTITGTFTNSIGTPQTYGNIGIEVTAGGNTYLVSHDQTNGGTGYLVSPSGTVAVTYTVTVS